MGDQYLVSPAWAWRLRAERWSELMPLPGSIRSTPKRARNRYWLTRRERPALGPLPMVLRTRPTSHPPTSRRFREIFPPPTRQASEGNRVLRLFRGARLGPGVRISPPSAPIENGVGLDHVGETLRTSYPEDEPENLDGRLTALMLQLSIDPPEGEAPVRASRDAWAEAWTAMATMSRTCWTALVRTVRLSFRPRVR